MKRDSFPCPLCNSSQTTHFATGENRRYRHCSRCDLVFVPDAYLVSPAEERAKYDHHQNTPQNSGYVDFLNRLLTPLEDFLQPGDAGLDFGSGPGPTLHLLMHARGYPMEIYDPFYAPDTAIFRKKYDFITMTEVIEHMHRPLAELERLMGMLHAGGVLGIMTAFRVDDFDRWYYKRDLTHIRFFTPETFRWIADYLGATLHIPRSGVVILEKSPATSR